MILLLAMLVGVVVSWALGARLSLLGDIRFRGDWLVFGALALQFAIFTPLADAVPVRFHTPLHIVSYLMILAFLLVNLRRSGLWLVSFGVFANVLVIFANGGHMPVSLSAWKATGAAAHLIEHTGAYNNNVLAGPDTRLAWLGDIFALPPSVPLANALSIGDVLIMVGMACFIYRAGTPQLPRPPAGLFAPLRVAAFRRVLMGRTTSRMGDWMTMTAAVTWIYATTHSTGIVSAFLIARVVASGIGGLASASLLDRLGGFRTLTAVEAMRGAATLLMIPFAAADQVWPVVVLACLSSAAGAATNPCASSLIPDVLPRALLQSGNALHGVARNIMMVLGAALGGLATIQLGIEIALALDVLTFVLAGALYWRFTGAATASADADADAGGPIRRRDILAGILTNRLALGLTASFAVVTAAMGVMNASLPAFFDARFGDADAYGTAIAAIGAGLLCGELLTGFIRREAVARRSVGMAFLGMAALVTILWQAGVSETAYLLLFLLGAADGTTEVVYDTLVQLHVPRRMRAGTFAVAGALANAGMVAGMAAAPLLVGAAGIASLKASAVLCVIGAAIAAISLVDRNSARRFVLLERAGSADLATAAGTTITPLPAHGGAAVTAVAGDHAHGESTYRRPGLRRDGSPTPGRVRRESR